MQREHAKSDGTAHPVVGLPACRKLLDPHWFHVVGEKYLDAVVDVAGALPVVVPALGDRVDRAALLDRLDGIVLTGSLSNVEPARYGGAESAPGTLHDAARDATTLPFIRDALRLGVPVLAICRGFQEMNVALGGSLDPAVHERDGALDHREDPDEPLEVRYGPAHDVELVAGGLLAGLTGARRIRVNSLHAQGIARLADSARIEATAGDGLVEAFTVPAAPGFNLAVQWHPEYRALDDPASMALFGAFGRAAAARAHGRRRAS